MKRLAIPLLFLLLLGVSACHRTQQTDGVIDPETMVNIQTDLYLIEGYYAVKSQYSFDTVPPEVADAIDAVLKEHHVSREQMEKSFDYYSQHPDEYKTIQEQISERIEKIIASGEEYSR